jgi:predicted secreted protein
MSTTAVPGHSSTLSGSVTGRIGQITKMDINGRKRNSIDISNCDSTDAFSEFIAGMGDEGELTLDVIYDGLSTKAAHVLDTAYAGATVQTWTASWPDGSSHAGIGFITNLGTAMSYDKEITQSVTIKFTGQITYTPA